MYMEFGSRQILRGSNVQVLIWGLSTWCTCTAQVAITARDPGDYVCYAETNLGDQPQQQTVTVGLGKYLQLA